jgi:hypothetical protein
MLSSSATKAFKSPLRKKKVVLPQSPISVKQCQVSFRSILRIRPLVGSEAEEDDNNILSIECQESSAAEL